MNLYWSFQIYTFQCVVASSQSETYIILNYKDTFDTGNYAQVSFEYSYCVCNIFNVIGHLSRLQIAGLLALVMYCREIETNKNRNFIPMLKKQKAMPYTCPELLYLHLKQMNPP